MVVGGPSLPSLTVGDPGPVLRPLDSAKRSAERERTPAHRRRVTGHWVIANSIPLPRLWAVGCGRWGGRFPVFCFLLSSTPGGRRRSGASPLASRERVLLSVLVLVLVAVA
jgi:hypothetical protein